MKPYETVDLRLRGALVFDRLCAVSGMTAGELRRHLQERLGRSHQMQPATLRSWRTGKAAVPFDALLAIADITHFRFPGIELLLLGEVIDDEDRRLDAFERLNNRHPKRALDARGRK